MPDEDDIEIDGFLESDESVEDLMKAEYGPKHEPTDEFFTDLQPQTDVREEEPEVSASPDEQLIKGRGIALTDIAADVDLDAELSKDEEMVAQHGSDTYTDPALNAVNKATESERARRERATMETRELLELAGDIVDGYFRKRVKTDGIDDRTLNRMKFAARKRVAQRLAEEAE